jgi:hypothetical protein
MALTPAPDPIPPVIRQQSVVQNSGPARELQVNLPLQSLPTSRVLIVVFSTVSGGAKSHIPSSQTWSQIPLIGVGGYARFGNTLISAWLSRPGVSVYQAGSFKFAGLVGLAPEYSTALTFEFADCQDGFVNLSQQSWDESYINRVEAQAPAINQKARGVLAVAFAEGQHQFLEPDAAQKLLTQTSASGFFSAPFSVAGSYAEQTSNDPSDVSLPFDGLSAPAGLLLFSAGRGGGFVSSTELTHSTDAFLAYPGATITVDSDVRFGGDLTSTVNSYLQFPPMLVMASSNAVLFGVPEALHTVGTQLFAAVVSSFTINAFLEDYISVATKTDIGLLGMVTKTHTTDTDLVSGGELTHSTDTRMGIDLQYFTNSYIFAGQTSANTDADLWSMVTSTHTTTAAIVTLNTSTFTTDSYLQATNPSATITTDSFLEQDGIIGMTGWELQDLIAESDPILTPDYTPNPNTSIFVTASAKRPGSQGTVGLRIDNNTTDQTYWVLPQTAKSLNDLYPTIPWPRVANQVFRETWATLYFRCNNRPTSGSELVIADTLSQTGPVGGPGPGGGGGGGVSQVYGYCYWVTIGNLTLGGGGGGLQLGHGDITVGNVAASYSLTDSNWHRLEVRTYKSTNTTLSSANVSDPITIEIYLDYNLIMSMVSEYPSDCSYILGVQERLTSDHYQIDYDDFVVSTSRLAAYDLSVIAKPAKAAGTYAEWTGTPSNTFADVASIPYDAAKYFASSALNQRQTFKVYSGGDANPYPGKIHAASMQFVHFRNTSSSALNMALMIREGSTDLVIKSWAPNAAAQYYVAMSSTTTRSPVAGLNWEDAIYNFEIGIKQVVNSSVNRVVGVYANLLVSPFSCFQTVESVLFGFTTLTHTTSSSLGRILDITTDALMSGAGASFTTNASIIQFLAVIHDTDSTLFGAVEFNHSTDAFINRVAAVDTDALIVIERGTSPHTSDAALVGQIDSSHDTDALVSILIDLPHTTDALPYRLVATTHLTDAAVLSNPSVIHLTNARTIGTGLQTHNTNSVARAPIVSGFTTDALKHLRLDVTHFTSASKKGDLLASFTTSSATAPTNVITKLTFVNSLLGKAFSATNTADAMLKTLPTLTSTTNAILFGSSQASHACNSWIVIPALKTITHLATSAIKGEATAFHNTTAVLKSTFLLASTTDAWLLLIGQVQQTTNAVLQSTRLKSHISNALLVINPALTITTDAFLKITAVLNHSTSCTLTATPVLSSMSTSILFGQTGLIHPTDAILKLDQLLAFTTTAALAFEKLFSTNSFVIPSGERIFFTASSLFGSVSALHTTNVLVYAQLSALHLSSSTLQAPLDITHTTTGDTFGSADQTHATDLLAAHSIVYNTFTNTSGIDGTDTSTSSYLLNDDRGIFEDTQGGVFDGSF